MSGKSYMSVMCLAFAISIYPAFTAMAQETSKEFWPEIDVWWRLSPSWRLSMYVPISKNLETKYREGNLVLQADYAWGKTKILHIKRLLDENKVQQMKGFLARGGYLGAKSLDDKGETYQEDMAYLEFHMRNPLKGGVLISHRLRTEFRWIGDDNELSGRVRYRFMAEKDFAIKRVSLVPYFNVEPYYDSRYETVNRVRLIGGTSVSWTPRIAFEGNITYQHDSRSSVTNLYALNIILHIFFETGRAKKQ